MCHVDVVMSQKEEHAKAFAKKWGIPKWVTSVEAIMESEADVIHICTPPATHGTLVKSALDAGKHVLCEKPLSLSQTEAKDLAEQAAMSGKICGNGTKCPVSYGMPAGKRTGGEWYDRTSDPDPWNIFAGIWSTSGTL